MRQISHCRVLERALLEQGAKVCALDLKHDGRYTVRNFDFVLDTVL